MGDERKLLWFGVKLEVFLGIADRRQPGEGSGKAGPEFRKIA